MTTGSAPVAFLRQSPDGVASAVSRDVPVECPVAIEFNGVGYAVMMASPVELEDFAVGFALTERLIERVGDVVAVDIHAADRGMVVRLTLSGDRSEGLYQRVRHRTSDSSCGMCGLENLDAALRPLPMVPDQSPIERAAIFRALAALRDHQPLNRATGAVHAAARCTADGTIVDVREDVGRHNAFDKLIGAMLREGAGWDGGFALLSSRCSYELVEKAALSGCSTLVTVSAATSLAIERARSCGLALMPLARADAFLVPA